MNFFDTPFHRFAGLSSEIEEIGGVFCDTQSADCWHRKQLGKVSLLSYKKNRALDEACNQYGKSGWSEQRIITQLQNGGFNVKFVSWTGFRVFFDHGFQRRKLLHRDRKGRETWSNCSRPSLLTKKSWRRGRAIWKISWAKTRATHVLGCLSAAGPFHWTSARGTTKHPRDTCQAHAFAITLLKRSAWNLPTTRFSTTLYKARTWHLPHTFATTLHKTPA